MFRAAFRDSRDVFLTPSPQNPYKLDVNVKFLENQTGHGRKQFFYEKKIIFFKKSNWTTNIFMLVNLELISGLILEINSIPYYLPRHTVAAMCFHIRHLVKKVR